MGYYVRIEDSTLSLPKENYDEALDILKELNDHDNLKHGGGSDGKKWFSWMPEDYDKTVTSVKEIFELLGFEMTESVSGLSEFRYDSKIGDEEIFLSAISHLLDGYIVWHGDDGDMWKFKYGKDVPEYFRPTIKWIGQ